MSSRARRASCSITERSAFESWTQTARAVLQRAPCSTARCSRPTDPPAHTDFSHLSSPHFQDTQGHWYGGGVSDGASLQELLSRRLRACGCARTALLSLAENLRPDAILKLSVAQTDRFNRWKQHANISSSLGPLGRKRIAMAAVYRVRLARMLELLLNYHPQPPALSAPALWHTVSPCGSILLAANCSPADSSSTAARETARRWCAPRLCTACCTRRAHT